jgi:hypothetical protein
MAVAEPSELVAIKPPRSGKKLRPRFRDGDLKSHAYPEDMNSNMGEARKAPEEIGEG